MIAAALLAQALATSSPGESSSAPAPGAAPSSAPAASSAPPAPYTIVPPPVAPAPAASPSIIDQALDPQDAAPSVRPFEMPEVADAGGSAWTPPPDPKIPVKVEDYHRSYEGPRDPSESYYDAGIKGAYQAELALRGGLEGVWTLSSTEGAPLFTFVISDPGGYQGSAGGAWRDLSRGREPDASGLIDHVTKSGREVTLLIRLKEGAPPAVIRLQPGADGRWRGELSAGAAPRAVVMERRNL